MSQPVAVSSRLPRLKRARHDQFARPSHRAASHPIAAVAARFVHKSVHNTASSTYIRLGVGFGAVTRGSLVLRIDAHDSTDYATVVSDELSRDHRTVSARITSLLDLRGSNNVVRGPSVREPARQIGLFRDLRRSSTRSSPQRRICALVARVITSRSAIIRFPWAATVLGRLRRSSDCRSASPYASVTTCGYGCNMRL